MKIDICLPTKNSIATLPKLFKSLEKQIYITNARVLIADGSSSDKTLEYVNNYKFCKIISYADDSPEDALNKLIKFDPKNLKIIVGSDDWLSKEYLSSFLIEAEKLHLGGEKKFILVPMFYKNIGTNLIKPNLPLPLFFLNFIGIGRGIGWGVFNHDGDLPLFSQELEIATDYDYLLKCLNENYKFKYVKCKYFHLKNGRSSRNWLVGIKEERSIGLKYCKNSFLRFIINILFGIKYIYKLLTS